jgi:hypothetical protein
MGRDRAERIAPDLFSTATASALPTPKASIESEPRRYVLHGDLHNAVKHLSEGELDLMHAAALEEIKRRGRTPRGEETSSHARSDLTKVQSPPTEKRRHIDIAEVPLTRGQVNAVRAAFKAGITPSRIARQFGISQSNVRKALSSDHGKSHDASVVAGSKQ